MRCVIQRAVLIALVAFMADCKSGDSVTGSSSDPEGEWRLTITHGANSCGGTIDPLETYGVSVAASGSNLTMNPSAQPCSQSLLLLMSGNIGTWGTTVQHMFGTCTTQEDRGGTVAFSSNTFSGQATYTEQYVSGDCSGIPLPCTQTDSWSGTRCSGCYSGCS